MTYIRRRGTAIVETSQGILVVAGEGGLYLLPGGAARKGESRTSAAIRELREETGLIATDVKFLFRHMGHLHKSNYGGYFRDYHTVVLIRADGIPVPKHEVRYLSYYSSNSRVRVSQTTREIIDRFYTLTNHNSMVKEK